MGFYVRKSFRAGPVRLNLSKSGLGASIGVKGARVGVSSRGRTYASGGVGGLYFRQNLGGGRRPTGRNASGTRRPAVILEEDTGATYASAAVESRSSAPTLALPPKPRHRVMAAILPYPVFALGVILFALAVVGDEPSDMAMYGLSALVLLMTLGWPVLLVRQLLRVWRARRLAGQVQRLIAAHAPRKDLKSALRKTRATAGDVAYVTHRAYLDLLDDVLADQIIDDDELTWLIAVKEDFGIPDAFASQAHLHAFRTVYLESVSDHDLSASEEATLAHVRERLRIPDSDIEEELGVLDQLRDLRDIRGGQLPEISCGTKLQRGEVCHFEGPGRKLKRKKLRSFQEDGQRYQVEGLVIDKEGEFYVTNKRVLLVDDGTTSVRHDKVLDVELDVDQSLISIVKDGAQRALLFSTPDAKRAAAVIASAAGL